MKVLVCIALVVMVCAPAAVAQDDESQETDETTLLIQDSSPDTEDAQPRLNVFSAWDFIRMILILGAVIAAIYGIFYLLKRSGTPKMQENRLIRVLSSKALTNNRSLHLIEIGNQVFLVGASENNVGLVSEIVDKETLDGIHLQAESVQENGRRSFSEVLSGMFTKETQDQTSEDPLGFLRQQRQRVKHM